MKNKNKIIFYLKQAIEANEKGKSLFNNNNYSTIPEDKKIDIEKYCNECGSCFKKLREELDLTYSRVYQFFYDGGIESDCRIAKNRWCLGLIEFAKARLKDLESD